MADYSFADDVIDDGGFEPVGELVGDGPVRSVVGDDVPVRSWGKQVVRSVQPRREVTFGVTLSGHYGPLARQRQTAAQRLHARATVEPYAALWELMFGVDVRPARPTLREALVDVWDALRALVLVVWLAVYPLPGRAVDRVLDGAYEVYDVVVSGVLSRWEALIVPYPWGRRPGPVVRTWDADFNLVHVVRFPVEPVGRWLRRIVGHVWEVLRHG
ncbi:hypothetical protein PBI_MDAVU_69 [Mycobacterium phage Mdavu]|uniref:Uncharacterized protein n=1 Tax=Mycobacterium phage Amelie TaxID=1913035 RepID=A0A1J0GRG8_9CAUD|nr:hypothetical protein AVV01_gp70 [Mycobacterium phage Enkosi]YP_009952586.1 hypothetical protein I5G92_gp68 [Mycobacterium phage Amelie]AVP42646.1 hypothetical protein SEA_SGTBEANSPROUT_69 [Mycobacterium phage SgtBeansprout]QGJ93353.1 hypothetical protein PBI_MDAVU_69 [Mycobacterium phage Mdavu]UQS94468.1 hypothetical protein SEA_NUTELLO_68 [Mycobacterium phage Nutello]UXE03231.1 hypothetical protein SEA_NIKAO_71 [Mycobacterium phage Nikao]ALF01447.1 hypothetical protein ENKOSI_70 [Mycobact